MPDTQKFKVSRVENIIQESKEIGSTARQIVGVRSAEVACACGHEWIAREDHGLAQVIGGAVLTCPICNVSEHVHLRLLGAA